MAGSLGSLVVSLGLNAAEFTTGLTKSEYEAKKFAQRMDRAITTGAKAAGAAMLGLGAAAVTAFAAISELASQAGNFKDLEEKTGANAEALASFAVAAGTAGVGIDTIAGAMNKLTKGLVTTEDETKDAGAALAALGIPLKEFKALDPAAQIETVAKALAGFQDGAAKSAVAMALFGKAGAELLPFLKELAAEGGRQVILTQAQIERADAFSDAQARARTQVQLYIQALATEALPTVTAAITAAKNFAASILGVSTEAKKLDANVIRQFAESAATSLAFVADSFDALVRIAQITGVVISTTAKQLAIPVGTGFLAEYNRLQDEASKKIDGIIARQTLRNALEREFARDPNIKNGFHSSGIDFSTKKTLTFAGKAPSSGGAEKLSDAEKLIESLEKQLDRTKDLTVLEQVELEISKAKFSGLTNERLAAIELLAVRIQDAEIAKKAAEDQRRMDDEAARIREQNSKELTKKIDSEMKEAQGMRDVNDRYEEQIIFLKEGEDGIRRLNAAKLDKLILDKKDELAAAQSIENNERMVAAINEQIAALEKRKGLVGDLTFAEQLKKEADQLQNLKDSFSDALTGPLYDFITGTQKAGDAFKSFIKNINNLLADKAARGIADYIFGGKTSGGFDFSTILKLFGSFFGGGGGGFSSAGLDAGTFGPGSGFGFGNYATGTPFAPGGRSWVGENGPELVDLPRGARVMSSEQSQRMTAPIQNFHINVMPGADTRAARQAGLEVSDRVRRVTARR